MSVTVTLPEVSACDATGCAYNAAQRCHAPAITIGNTTLPECDTFLPDSSHVAPRPAAGVGACKVHSCRHNIERTCAAGSIVVGVSGDSPECSTFAPRPR